jgi:peptidyl-prolyl cis-trans isomerase SurA
MKQLWSVTVALALGSAAIARAEIMDGVVAVVNDRVITLSEVRMVIGPILPQLQRDFRGEELNAKLRSLQTDAINSLIERALILDEFKTKGYTIPENTIDRELSEIIASEFNNDRGAFTRTLQAQNLTVTQYREKLRERVIIQAMRGRKGQQYLVISPHRIEQYYRDHLKDFAVEDQVKLRMIFIKKAPAEGDAAPDARRKLGEEILGKLDAGESFESLAKLYSEGKEAKQGGDWGWVGKDVLRKELGEVAFQLKAKQHSKLIETAEGYYLLFVEDVKPAHTKPLTEARDDIEKILIELQRDKMQDEWIKTLRAKAYIRLY